MKALPCRPLTVLCLALQLFLLGTATLAESRGPIVFGGTLSLTGRYAALGAMQQKGYILQAEELNAAGGLLGRKVVLRITDDGSDPQKATAAYTALLRGGKVDFILSPYSSELTLAATPLVEKYHAPMLAAGASSDTIWETPRRYTFGLYSTSSRYFIGFLELCAIHNMKSIAIVGFPDVFSLSAAEGAKKWAEKFGLSVSRYSILKNLGESAILGEVEACAAARPDVVLVAGHLQDTVAFRKALEQTGFKPKAFAGSVGPAMGAFREALGNLSEGAFGPTQWEPDARIPYPGSRVFIEHFRQRFGVESSYHAATAYAALRLLADAILANRSTNREKVRNTLATHESMTLLGPYKIREDGTQIGHRSFIIQWQKGQKEIVWPDSMRTASPIFSP